MFDCKIHQKKTFLPVYSNLTVKRPVTHQSLPEHKRAVPHYRDRYHNHRQSPARQTNRPPNAWMPCRSRKTAQKPFGAV